MSRTKYTHLVDQDTSQGGWGAAARPMGQGQQGQFEQGCWNCGGPHLRKGSDMNIAKYRVADILIRLPK